MPITVLAASGVGRSGFPELRAYRWHNPTMLGRRSKPLYYALAIIYGVFCLSLVYVLLGGNGNAGSFVFAVILGGASVLSFRMARRQSPDSRTPIR